jgi:2,3-bisphosphoglycerate-dependent phosphoglycerate mutase
MEVVMAFRMRYDDAAECYPQVYAALMVCDLDARFPAGVHVVETVREFSERTGNTLLLLLGRGSFRRIAVVSHGGVLDYIYRFAKNLSLDQPRSCDVFNASINRLTWRRE